MTITEVTMIVTEVTGLNDGRTENVTQIFNNYFWGMLNKKKYSVSL